MRTNPRSAELPRDPDDSLLFQTLVDLIKHSDLQIANSGQFHFTAIGALVPILGYLVTQRTHPVAVAGIMLLAVALAANWSLLSTKLTLQKLCWVRQARAVEEEIFGVAHGPFTEQDAFFKTLSRRGVTTGDRLLLQQVGLARMKLVPVVLLLAAIGIMAGVGIARYERPNAGLAPQTGQSPNDTKSEPAAPSSLER